MSIRTIRAKWALPLLLAVVAMPLLVSAQSIVCVDTSLATFAPQIEYWKIDLNNCTDSLLEEEGGYQSAFDITIRSDGLLYGYGITNFPGDSVLFEDGFVFGSGFFPGYLIFDPQIEGLTCDENGFAYAAGKGITKVSTEWPDSQESYLGDLPTGMQCQGDITYRKGKFYVVATGNKLVQVDMKNPANSQIVMEFPPGTLPIHGLTTVQLDCDSVATYAVGRATSHSEVYFVDFESWTSTLVCDLPGRAFTGAASFTECMLPPCSVFVDLDGDNSSFGFLGNRCADTFCITPIAVADTDVVVLSGPGFLDSITLQLTGILDGAAEFLTVPVSGPNIQAAGNGTTSLLLMANGASLIDFEEALKAIVYVNNAPMPTPGMRRVLVLAWAGGEASPLSVAELPLFNPSMQFQFDLTEPSCQGYSDGSIALSPNGGTPPYQYLWDNGETDNLAGNLSEGDYGFTVTDALGCATTGSASLGEPDTLTVTVSNVGATAICNSTGALAAIPTGGTYPYTYDWDNSSTDSLNTGIGPGTYNLILHDANGCIASSSATIPSGDTVLIVQPKSICEGENFTWQGTVFSTDTLVCLIFTMPNGCDSTLCLDLLVNPAPEVNIGVDGNLCDGEEVALDAGQHENYLWSTGETEPVIEVDEAGTYSVQVTDGVGCTAEGQIEVLPGLEFVATTVQPGCGGDANGTIEINNIVEGSPPFGYSLNGSAFSPGSIFEGLTAGVYSLAVMDANGCSKSVTVELNAATEIFIDAGEDHSINLGEGVTLTAFTNVLDPVVSWTPPDGLDMLAALKVTANPVQSTLYTVTVTDVNGCSAQDEVQVTVIGGSSIYAPNAFSPNGDGVNDEFRLFTDNSIQRIEYLRIFDRWGGLVYEKTGFNSNSGEGVWDGTANGKAANLGTYVFVAKALSLDGTTHLISSEFNLIR